MFQPDLIRGDTPASKELLQSIEKKGKTIVFAILGSDEARLLDFFSANASVNTSDINHIIVRPDVLKIEILEEFMIAHQKLLGLSKRDVLALIIMKNSYMKGLQQ